MRGARGGPRADNALAGEISRENMATMPDTGTVVAVAQLGLAVGELDANRQAARAAVAEAAAAGARLVVLPELSDSGYVFSDADEARSCASPAATGVTLREWRSLAGRHNLVIVGGFCELGPDGRGLERHLQQAVAAFTDGARAVVRLVELLLLSGQAAAFGFLECHGDGVGLAFIVQIPKGAPVTGGLDQGGQDLAVGTYRGGVVLASRAHLGRPDRPAVWDADDLHVAAVVVVFARPPQVHPEGWSGRGHPVGLHQDPVDVHVAVSSGLGHQVPSRNQRNTSTAWSWQDRDRVSVRVPL